MSDDESHDVIQNDKVLPKRQDQPNAPAVQNTSSHSQQQQKRPSEQPEASEPSQQHNPKTTPQPKVNNNPPPVQVQQDKINTQGNSQVVVAQKSNHQANEDSFEDQEKSEDLGGEIPSYYKNNASALEQSTDQVNRSRNQNSSHHKTNPNYNNGISNNNSNILDSINNHSTKDEQVSPLKGRNIVATTASSEQKAKQLTAAQELREQQMDKLVMQNLNLREQLREMATMLDDIIEREKEQRAMKYSQNSRANESEPIKQRRKELQKQTDLIASNRILISQKKRQLEYNFDINRITEKENEIKRLKKELEELLEERLGLQKISDDQIKARADIDRKEYRDQLEVINKQYMSAKEENQMLSDQIQQKDKELKKYIDELKMRTEKIRSVNLRAKQFQRKKPVVGNKLGQKKEEEEEISEENLQILQERVIMLEKERTDLEKSLGDKIRTLEKDRKTQQAEVDKKQLVLKEREKTLKLTKMKLKEITKFIKATAAENEKKQQMAALQAKQEQQSQLPMQEDAKLSAATKGRGAGSLSRVSRNR